MVKKEIDIIVGGIKLKGHLMVPNTPTPPSVTKKFPVLILCHGIPRDQASQTETSEMTYPELAEQFCHQGFLTFFFNFRGAGPSEGNFHIKGWIEDLHFVIEYIVKVPEADESRIFLCGSSAGAAVSVVVAAGKTQIKGVICLACPARFDRLTEEEGARSFILEAKRFGLIKNADFPPSLDEWREEFRASQPIDFVADISPRPLLLVHGSADDVVPLDHAHELYARAGKPKDLKIFAGRGHRLRMDPEVISFVFNWLQDKCSF
ncbi:MAG: alpha/beta hydrolase [Candidatus Tectomicrobia bacterium]|uniref:Alpha/beta hydrolase n=1 Tax=Tectimicrobiota bacterium TaxID=2528274 RepID=A0A933LQX6_UNCTE|nr:alpha/beta hydrolase [Candidatus Tectomicrobia bacterium]